MDYDFLDKSFINSARKAIADFREAVEQVTPPEAELELLCKRIEPYPHTRHLEEEFTICGVDGSGEYPILQQDDVFVYFSVASGKTFRTESQRQHKLATVSVDDSNARDFVVIRDESKSLQENYARFLDSLTGKSLADLVRESDYCSVYSRFGKSIGPGSVVWKNLVLPKASQISSHAYQIRTVSEIGMALRMLSANPKYILVDSSLVYFLLGESLFLPEILKRHLICRANAQGTAIIAFSKSHNIPNGDLIGRKAKEERGFKDHWFLRLPSEELGEVPLPFLKEKEVPPKLGISYLFKFHTTSFPMRIDVDADWWRENINGDVEKERRLFADLDYTCHDVRSYGYPYPMHAAHRTASLTKQERKAIRDILLQQAKNEGLLRGAFLRDPESLHQGGI